MRAMQTTLRITLTLAALALAGGCRLSDTEPPPLAGPSEFALALGVSAKPDVVTQDGQSQSLLTVVARDANNQPVRGLSLRLAMFVDGLNVDYGTLSSKSISTDNTWQASALYTAPQAPPPTVTTDTTVEIQVLPVGADFASTTPRSVLIRLARGGVILPPNPPLVPSFFASPTQPHENETVQFDASASTGKIVSYAWTFGDGSTGTGVRPSHSYAVAGVYNVTLTITDDRGVQASTDPKPVNVITSPDPVALFSISPTDPIVGDAVIVDASASTVATGRTIVSYEWNFGDGRGGTGRIASHTYDTARTYTIVLTVTDNTGRKGVVSRTVQVR